MKLLPHMRSMFYFFAAALTGFVACSHFDWSAFNYAILLVFFLAYLVYSTALPSGNRREKTVSFILALIYSGLNLLPKVRVIAGGFIPIGTLVSTTIVTFLLILSALRFVLAKLEIFDLSNSSTRDVSRSKLLLIFFISTALIFASYIPFYLADFPGVMVTDSYTELKMINGIRPLSDHHPLAHTMMIKVLFSLGEALAPASENAGIICYCIVQMLFASAVFSYALVSMRVCNVKSWFIVLSFCYFAFASFNSTLSFVVWKDTPFALSLLAFATTIWRIIYKRRNGLLPNWFDTVILFISAFGTCMLRHNGIAAVVPLAVFFCILYFKSSKRVLAVFLLVFALFGFYKGPLLQILDIKSHDSAEAMCIPIQQVAQAIMDGVELSEEESALLSGLFDIEKVPEFFTPGIADPMKNLIRQQEGSQDFFDSHKWELAKLYLRIGMRNPASYISAYADQTLCYWNPDFESVVLMTHTLENNPATPLSSQLWYDLHAISFKYASIPYFGLLFSVGGVFWICLFLISLGIIRRQYLELLAVLPSMCIVLTIFAGTAVNNEMRYVYSMFTCLPLIFAVVMCRTSPRPICSDKP